MKTEKWSFTNGEQTKIVFAADGAGAWQELAKLVGIKNKKGNFVLSSPHKWIISCVCICGKTQSTKYCSESCYDKAMASKLGYE